MMDTSVARTPPRRRTSTMVRHSIVSKPSAARMATADMFSLSDVVDVEAFIPRMARKRVKKTTGLFCHVWIRQR